MSAREPMATFAIIPGKSSGLRPPWDLPWAFWLRGARSGESLGAPPLRGAAGLVFEQNSGAGQLFPNAVGFREVLGRARRPARGQQRFYVGIGHRLVAHA